MKMQTYTVAIEKLLSTSAVRPPELLLEIENFIEANKNLGYTTREELIREAMRFKLNSLKGQYEYVEVPKEDYEKLEQALRDLDTGFLSADDFVEQQIEFAGETRTMAETERLLTKRQASTLRFRILFLPNLHSFYSHNRASVGKIWL
jgi:hypothetical protein